MCDRTIFVSSLPKDTSKDDLQIYFQSKKKSGGGDVEEIAFDSTETGIAKIVFADSHGKQLTFVDGFRGIDIISKYIF